MNEARSIGSPKKRWTGMPLWWNALLLALASAGCAITTGPPGTSAIQGREGRHKAVLLLRVVTEVEGRITPPFPSIYAGDNVMMGLGDFSSAGQIGEVMLRFFSADTRKEGWIYLLLEPGQVYYLAAQEPVSPQPKNYRGLWAACPRWSVEIPADARLVYGGTLYLPGSGQWTLFSARRLAAFDRARVEVRNEADRAELIAKQWLANLGPVSVQLARKWEAGDTIILQTPPGKRAAPR
jgi:hypothetical protein